MSYKLALDKYKSYEDYIDALRQAGFTENLLGEEVALHFNGDESIAAIKQWHEVGYHCGVACTIDCRVGPNDEMIEGFELYPYVGEANDHRRLQEDECEPTDYSKYFDELVKLGIIEEEDDVSN